MDKLRIVLLGKQGAGKSSAGNTLLGKRPFHTAGSSQRVTKDCSMGTCIVDGRKICVVDTPGWTDLLLMEDETTQEIAKCIDLIDPGPHVFLLVIPIGRFTREEINTAQQILEVFGEESRKYTMVLFTKGDDLEEKTIEEYLEGVHEDLKKILEVCGGRYHVFNNRDKKNQKQVSDLLEKIKVTVEGNKGKHYTKAMYQNTADQMQETWRKQKNMKIMIEEEYRKQTSNSSVGSNDDAMIRKNAETFETVGIVLTENKEEEDKPYLQEVESQLVVVKQSQDRHVCYKQNSKPVHESLKHHKKSQSQADKLENNSKEFCEIEFDKTLQIAVQRLIKLEMETWLKEKDELKREIQQLQNDVKHIYSLLNKQHD